VASIGVTYIYRIYYQVKVHFLYYRVLMVSTLRKSVWLLAHIIYGRKIKLKKKKCRTSSNGIEVVISLTKINHLVPKWLVVCKNIHKTNIIQTNKQTSKQASKTYGYLSLQNKDSEIWLRSEVMKLISGHRNSFRFQNKSKMNSVPKDANVYV